MTSAMTSKEVRTKRVCLWASTARFIYWPVYKPVPPNNATPRCKQMGPARLCCNFKCRGPVAAIIFESESACPIIGYPLLPPISSLQET